MRALGILALCILLSWAVSAIFQVAFGLAVDAREEMVFSLVVEPLAAVLVALVFGVVLAAGGGRQGVAFAAVALILLGIVSLAGLEAFALADQAAAVDPSDAPLMIELGVPGVVTVVLQAWLLRTYLKRRGLPAAAAVPAKA